MTVHTVDKRADQSLNTAWKIHAVATVNSSDASVVTRTVPYAMRIPLPALVAAMSAF